MSKLKAIVTLDTGEKIEFIHIYDGDDIEVLAEYFCERHQIIEDGKQFIINEIRNQLIKNNKRENKIQKQSSIFNLNYSSGITTKKPLIKKADYDNLHNGIWNKIERKRKISPINKKNDNYELRHCETSSYFFNDDQNKNQKKGNEIQCQKRTKKQQDDLAKRLISQKSVSEKRLQDIRFKSHSPTMHNFKPQITKDAIFQKVSKKIDKQDYELAQIAKNREKPKIFGKFEQKIVYRQDLVAILKLFQSLDNDHDGQISSQFINLNIDHQVLEKIMPILCHMEEQHLILDVDSFTQLIRSFNILIF